MCVLAVSCQDLPAALGLDLSHWPLVWNSAITLFKKPNTLEHDVVETVNKSGSAASYDVIEPHCLRVCPLNQSLDADPDLWPKVRECREDDVHHFDSPVVFSSSALRGGE